MTLAAGTKLGPYEILAPIGAGGMGEVYKAKDTRLDREVAIKVLPTHLSDNPELKQRFEREARAIAALSHPHICAIHDVGSQDGVEYLVMELLEGQTLAERVDKGPLPTDQVLKFGVEIADALDKAHRHGIIHRDLKPGNVMLTKSGVKLLDFGLAKHRAAATQSEIRDFSSLPTEVSPSRPLTEQGTIIGTFQYMAPEQLEGKEADARTDIFAFGCVLYEMATGQKAFSGKSRLSLVSSILRDDPRPISSIAPMTPPALDRVVKTCLAKDPEDRFQTAHDAKLQLEWIAEAGSQAGAPAVVVSKRKNRERLAWSVAAGVALLATVLGTFLVHATFRAREQAQTVIRAKLLPPKGERLFLSLRAFAISPDGKRLVYSVQKGVTSELRLRPLDSEESTAIPGTEGGSHPFFSPDGKWIGFVAGPKLKKVALAGGTPVTLCDAPLFRGAFWGEDGSIYFVPNVYVPISRISADGGAIQPVTRIRTKEGEQQHRWPETLPGGKVILYAIGSGADWDEATIVAERLGTGERKVLVRGGTFPRYLPAGYLVYARAGALYALSFDARSLKVEGSPVEVARNIFLDPSGLAQMDISRTGVLITAPSDTAVGDLMLTWIDREGRGEPLKAPHQSYAFLALSPDESRVAMTIGNSIAILDIARLSMTKLTLPARAEAPAWSRDGRRIYFGLEKEKFYQIFSKAADDSGAVQLAFPSDSEEDPFQISADGSRLLYIRTLADGLNELCLRHMGNVSSRNEPKVLFKSLFLDQTNTAFSPDGRWVVYQSEESGRPEIYVRPASGEERKWPVSTEGGAFPIWSPVGNEIFYLCGMKVLAAPVGAKGEEFVAGAPKVLFESHEIFAFNASHDGKRFLVAENPNPGAQPRLDIAVNWFAEVRRKVREAKAP
jgi:Tol biopolymer transport system component/tRNA A-37 threonylcarbamoyl transferase component Bud32